LVRILRNYSYIQANLTIFYEFNMSFTLMTGNRYTLPTHFLCIALGLFLGLVFLLLPGTCIADIENLYAENYSSSVAITNPSNGYGPPDGDMAESTDKEKWGVFLQNWTFSVADSGNTTEVFQSAEFYFTHYVGNGYFDDYIDLEYSPDNGENWYLLKRYTELDAPPTSPTTEGPFLASVISNWTRVNDAQFRIIGKGRILGEDVFRWFVDAVEMRVQYAISVKLTVTGTGIAPATVNAGDQNVGVTRIVLDPGLDTITVNSITVTRTGTAKTSDVATVSLYDDSGSIPGSFDAGDTEVPGAWGTFSGGTVTLTPTTSITLSGASETYYIVCDIPVSAVNGRTLGAQITSGPDIDCDADIVLPGGGGFPEPPVEDNATIQGGVDPEALSLTGTGIAPATVNNGQQDVGMVKLDLDPNGDNMAVYGMTVTRTGTALSFDVATVSLYDDSGATPGSFDAGDVELPGATGTFIGDTVTLDPTTPISLTGSPQTYYIVYDIDNNAVDGRTVGGQINSNSDIDTDADVNVEAGGGGFPEPAAEDNATINGVVAVMTVYGERRVESPRYITWDGASWSGENSAPSIGGEILWVVQRSSPLKDERILGVLDETGHLNLEVWDGTSWGLPLEVTPSIGEANSAYRGFDIAYEHVTGDALVVYHTGGNDPEYRIWDGISWSGPAVIDLPTGGVPVWIKMVPDATGSDEIILVTLDTSNSVTAIVWDGNSWGNTITLETSAYSYEYEGIAVAYENVSGRAMVAWGTSTSNVVQYRFWDAISWLGESEISTTATGVKWLRLAPDLSSNRIILGALCDGGIIDANTWDGTGWRTQLQLESSAESEVSRCFDVVWERSADQALVCWGQSGWSTIKYRTYDHEVWSWEQNGPDLGSGIEVVQLTLDPRSDEVFMATLTNDRDLQLTRWYNYSWQAPDEPETSMTYNTYEPFMVTYPGGLYWPTAVEMRSFRAHAGEFSVFLEWTTAHEIDNAGFHLHRSCSREGPYQRINPSLIPGQGYSVRGAHYRFLDDDVGGGITYYYKLEDVDFDGLGTFHGPVWATPGGDRDGDGMPDWWEKQVGLNPDFDDAKLDSDGDGLINSEEFFYGLAPRESDTDGDGISDADEIRDEEGGGETGGKGDESGIGKDGARIVESDDSGITVELVTTGFEEESVEVGDRQYQRVSIPSYSHGYSSKPGFPQVPVKGMLLEIPPNGRFSLAVLESEDETYSGYHLFPVPLHAARGGEGGTRYLAEQFILDQEAYSAARFYPGSPAALGYVGHLRDQRVLQLGFYPIQFDPATGTVRFHRRIRVRVSFHNLAGPQLFLRSRSTVGSSSFDGPTYKLSIRNTGICRLSYDYLGSNAPEILSEPASSIKLYNKGQEVALRVVEGEFIEFYALAEDTRYTDINVYWLTAGGMSGKRIEEVQIDVDNPEAPDSFWSAVRFEKNEDYWGDIPGDENTDRWFYRDCIGRIPMYYVREYSLDLKGVMDTGNSAILRVCLFGMADLEPHPNHHTRVFVNDHLVDDAVWDGQRNYLVEVWFPQSYLVEGENIVTVEALLDTGAEWDWILANWFEVGYWRRFDATADDQLKFNYGTSGEYEFRVEGFSSNSIEVFDITNSPRPKRILGLNISGTDPYSVTFRDSVTSEKTYLALTEEKIRTEPAGIERFESRNLRSPSNGADWIAIVHEDFHDAIQPLARHRTEQGLRAIVVTSVQAYDEFNHGIASPHGIKEFLRYAYENWQPPAPKYVVLVGDGTYDYREYYGQAFSNFVPAYLSYTAYAGEVPDDHWFGCVSGEDLISDLRVGRLPARTVADVGAMVDKILSYETSPLSEQRWERRILLVADNDEVGFTGMSEALASSVSSAYLVSRKYLKEYTDPLDLNRELIGQINDGALLVNYVGHGAEDYWADEAIFGAWDVESLQNSPRYPLVVAMTCLNGYFVEAFEGWDSLAEVLVRFANRGAVAVFTSTGITAPEEQGLLDRGFFEALFEGGKRRLGEAISSGELNLLANAESGGEVLGTFTLLGDPATELKVQSNGSGSSGFVSSGSSGSGGGCFIATAAYGSYAEGHVAVLRGFRDRYLLPQTAGRLMVNLYYWVSPPLADFIRGKGFFRCITRMGLSPLVGASLIFARVQMSERWPVFVTFGMILSVLLYMELLVRRHRGSIRRRGQPGEGRTSPAHWTQGKRDHRETPGNE
jgi:hypothetical protein